MYVFLFLLPFHIVWSSFIYLLGQGPAILHFSQANGRSLFYNVAMHASEVGHLYFSSTSSTPARCRTSSRFSCTLGEISIAHLIILTSVRFQVLPGLHIEEQTICIQNLHWQSGSSFKAS